MKVKKIKVQNLYGLPAVYDMMFNRSRSFKLDEATGFSAILEHYCISKGLKVKSVLELMAGDNSYHKRFLLETFQYAKSINYYRTLDKFAVPNDDVVAADPAKGDLLGPYDAVLAFYCTASSIVDPNHPKGFVTKSYMQDVFYNVCNGLKPGGVFLLDSPSDGYRESLNIAIQGRETNTYNAHLGSTLRAWVASLVKISDKDLVELTCTSQNHYDRVSANTYDVLSDMYVEVNGRKVINIEVEQPFCQRCFSETELTEMLLNAGFKRVDFWACDYKEQSFELLDPIVKLKNALDEPDDLMTNVFVAIR